MKKRWKQQCCSRNGSKQSAVVGKVSIVSPGICGWFNGFRSVSIQGYQWYFDGFQELGQFGQFWNLILKEEHLGCHWATFVASARFWRIFVSLVLLREFWEYIFLDNSQEICLSVEKLCWTLRKKKRLQWWAWKWTWQIRLSTQSPSECTMTPSTWASTHFKSFEQISGRQEMLRSSVVSSQSLSVLWLCSMMSYHFPCTNWKLGVPRKQNDNRMTKQLDTHDTPTFWIFLAHSHRFPGSPRLGTVPDPKTSRSTAATRAPAPWDPPRWGGGWWGPKYSI